MTETSEIGPLAKRRRGVAPGALLIWITLAAVGGAVVWAIYGDGVRSILKLPPASAHWAITPTNQNQPTATNLNELVGLVKGLQASQQRTADDVRITLQLLTSNAVSPGSIDTPGFSDLLASSETGEQRRKMIISTVPLGRFGTPDENREGRRVSRIRRQQLRHGNGAVCGWRLRTSVGAGYSGVPLRPRLTRQRSELASGCRQFWEIPCYRVEIP